MAFIGAVPNEIGLLHEVIVSISSLKYIILNNASDILSNLRAAFAFKVHNQKNFCYRGKLPEMHAYLGDKFHYLPPSSAVKYLKVKN